MKGSVRLFRILGIDINIHITFLLLPILFGLESGLPGVFIIIFVFLCVTLHELMHSLQAKRFGIKVDQIILLPIGGIASMRRMPEKPREELIVSLAGPLFNLSVALVFFYPLYKILGPENFFHPSLENWPQTFAYAFWINPVLAVFNLLPAFPMDGGRILRAFLAQKIDYQKATRIAVMFGHAFALFFAFWGIRYSHLLIILIAIFVYFAASRELTQVDIKMLLHKFHVQDILNRNFTTVSPQIKIAEILDLTFHTHQDDFPVMEEGRLVGFLVRNDILRAIHEHGMDKSAGEIMRQVFPVIKPEEPLSQVYNKLQESNLRAAPVVKENQLLGLVTLEDISRVYFVISGKS
jgi:Zn-dependent protease/CBS domain-containing protein